MTPPGFTTTTISTISDSFAALDEISPLALSLLADPTLSDKDRQQLLTPDSAFQRLTWPVIQKILAGGDLAELRRIPSDLAKYIVWLDMIKREYKQGGVMEFILKDKLGWWDENEVGGRPRPSGRGLFECPDDVSILINDWPYGLCTDPPIVHIVIWLKTLIPSREGVFDGDDLLPESRTKINEFVDAVFSSVAGKENVLWFKNWRALQSVPSVEHVHVLVRGATEEMVNGWVNGPWGGKRKR